MDGPFAVGRTNCPFYCLRHLRIRDCFLNDDLLFDVRGYAGVACVVVLSRPVCFPALMVVPPRCTLHPRPGTVSVAGARIAPQV
jgi:hypothetical protein